MGAGAVGGAGTASAMARRAIKGSFLSASKAKPTAPRVVEAPGAVTAHREAPEGGPDASVVAGIQGLSVEGGGVAAPAPAASSSSAAPLLSNKVVSFGGSSLAAAAPVPLPAAAAARSSAAAASSSVAALSAPVRQNFGGFGSTVEMSSTPTGASAGEDVAGGAAAEACAPGAAAGGMGVDADGEPAFPTPVKALSFAAIDRENAPVPSPTSGKVVSAMPHAAPGGLGLKSPAFAAGSKREPLSPTRPSNSFGRRWGGPLPSAFSGGLRAER